MGYKNLISNFSRKFKRFKEKSYIRKHIPFRTLTRELKIKAQYLIEREKLPGSGTTYS